ncbi:TonB-dependent receptor [Altererythrobacter sp. B11]|uniref:TonB-dependent receptor n=1 Tax=Altererythrobacter sp. B11 TaxID=2060312 RepID=UPI000DC6D769|nr:TonB-dependent receptor [Altererythrobacter sp. B11]BBC74091.1 TonB-dependent receptor [Altererythrobacter sp. B11]
MHSRSVGPWLALSTLLFPAAPAFAQAAEPPPPAPPADGAASPADPGGGPAIIVTARRRAENLADVPLAISIVQGETIDATGSFNVGRLQQLQPSLTFYSSNPRNTAVNIRGIGAPFGLTNDGIEQGVGIYIDDVYYARVAASTFDFLDVERIEVLRGPQGTLYGKNTTAGALNITSRQPTFDFEGSAQLSTGNLGYVQGKAALSGPLSDTVAARLVASATRRSGTLLNVTTGSKVNEIDNFGTRGQILWQPGDRFSLTLAADYNRQDPECCGQVFVRVAPTERAANRQFESLAAHFGYEPASRQPFDRLVDHDTELRARQSFGGVSARARLDLGDGMLTSVTAWRAWDWNPSNDRDYTALPITTISANPSSQRQWTQELRYNSGGGHDLDYVIGLFLFRQTIRSTGLQAQGSAASYWLLGPTAGSDPALLDGLQQTTDIDYRNDSAALFGRLTWQLASDFSIEPGLRLNYDRKRADYAAVASGGLETSDPALIARKAGVLQSQSYQTRLSDWNLSGDVTASWKPSADWLVYATYARSFKSGGVNLSGIPNRADGTPASELAAVKPEKVNHFEIGVKGTLAGGAGNWSLAAYRTDIRDYQATVVNGAVGVLRGYLANAAKVRTQGVEAELALRPVRGLTLSGSLAFTDATYVSFADAPPPLEQSGGATMVVDISGERLPGVSRWAASYSAEYAHPADLLGTAGEAFAAMDGSSRSRWSSSPTPSDYMWVDGFTLINLRAGYRADAGWEAFGWVRNAFDTETFDFLTAQSGSTGLIVGQPADPRSYGITLSAHF